MKKIIWHSFIIGTCADIFSGLILVTIYCLNHPPFDWGLFRFALIMGYFQQIIIILPVLIFCKILLKKILESSNLYLRKFSKVYYYLFLSIFYCALHLTVQPAIVPNEDMHGLILELFAIIGFDLVLYPTNKRTKVVA